MAADVAGTCTCRVVACTGRAARACCVAVFFLIVSWFGGAHIVCAGINVWTSNGPQGALPNSLLVDSSNSSTLYLGTAGGGVFKSTDSGGSWVAASTGLTASAVECLTLDPSKTSTLYAGAGGSVLKSTDGARTWTAANGGLPDPMHNYIDALVVDPSNPAIVYAAVYGNNSGVFKSVNGGGNWAAASTGLTNPAVTALVIDPSNPATLYAVAGTTVFKSTNGAQQQTNVEREATLGACRARSGTMLTCVGF